MLCEFHSFFFPNKIKAFSRQSFRECSGSVDKPSTGAQKNLETRVLSSQHVGHMSESKSVVS